MKQDLRYLVGVELVILGWSRVETGLDIMVEILGWSRVEGGLEQN